mmetsp:Transcript_5978/g.11144  ORF Transcript_5978/g.11144 Transcript_5978/m.11144 type:complete len:306 (-) Transcript_5978:347-1264(-)
MAPLGTAYAASRADITAQHELSPDAKAAPLPPPVNLASKASITQEPGTVEEDHEAAAKIELLSIHPTIRSEIVQSIDTEEWRAMSFAEKLAAVKARLHTVTTTISDFERESAWKIAHGEKSVLDRDPEPAEEENDSDDEDEDEEVMVVRKYWAPSGRCPYGMDTGMWEITEEEMRQHNSKHSCWVSIDGAVYDVTKWLKKHPGGADAILNHAGNNATETFRAIKAHSDWAGQKLQKFLVGHIVAPEVVANSQSQAPGAAPEVCPISGKTGVCPVNAMHGQTSELPEAIAKMEVSGKNGPGECPVS